VVVLKRGKIMSQVKLLVLAVSTVLVNGLSIACSTNSANNPTGSSGGNTQLGLGGNASQSGGMGVGGSNTGANTLGGATATGGTKTTPNTRPFLMGSTPFFAAATAFPDWRFENMDDRDLLALHVDDFLGVPWDQCSSTGCANLPASWISKWQDLADRAHASKKPIYLSISPLGDRKTLAKRVLADGTLQDRWLASAVVDSNGCYSFSTDANATNYQAAYIAFVKYVVELVQPTYLSPAIEMNIPFTTCAAQKSAWVTWYTKVHNTLKVAYPSLVVFPTFQLEDLYGVASTESACASGTTYDQCFVQRLAEALSIPGDRIALSSYPAAWKFSVAAGFARPADTFAKVSSATTRRIWISETGWNAVPIRSSYAHGSSGSSGSCGDFRIPASFDVAGLGTIDLANDSEHASYLAWLLAEAQIHNFEAVVWWLNRDYLDGNAASACPCAPADSDTCRLSELFYSLSGDAGDFAVRLFANMGLRYYDGTPRPGYATWKDYLARTYAP
jgi:hypothetical protein